MKRCIAPSSLAGEGFTDASQAPERPTDQSKSSVLLSARHKRKFVAPASAAAGQTAPTAGVFKVQRCKTVPATLQQQTKDDSSKSAASAQYFSVLYTKRATNKVCPAALSARACHQRWCKLAKRCAILQKKKNKSYLDGVLEVKEGNACTLFNEASCTTSPFSCLLSMLADCCQKSCHALA